MVKTRGRVITLDTKGAHLKRGKQEGGLLKSAGKEKRRERVVNGNAVLKKMQKIRGKNPRLEKKGLNEMHKQTKSGMKNSKR